MGKNKNNCELRPVGQTETMTDWFFPGTTGQATCHHWPLPKVQISARHAVRRAPRAQDTRHVPPWCSDLPWELSCNVFPRRKGLLWRKDNPDQPPPNIWTASAGKTESCSKFLGTETQFGCHRTILLENGPLPNQDLLSPDGGYRWRTDPAAHEHCGDVSLYLVVVKRVDQSDESSRLRSFLQVHTRYSSQN